MRMKEYVRKSLRITLIYSLAGLTWIILSDQLLLKHSDDIQEFWLNEIIKGVMYVLLTALLIYSLVKQRLKKDIQAKNNLLKSESRYRTTLEYMMEGCQIIDFDWRYQFLNETAAKHGKLTREELIGRTMMDAYPGIEATTMFKKLEKCMVERTPQRLENKFKYPDDSIGYFDLRVEPIPEGIFILSFDITDSKTALMQLGESEKKFRIITENSADAIFILNQEGKYQYANHKAISMLGYSLDEVINKQLGDFSPRENAEIYKSNFRTLLKERKGNLETELVTKENKRIPVDMNAIILPNNMVYVSCRDISERKRDEKIRETVYRISELFHENLDEEMLMEKIQEQINKVLRADHVCMIIQNNNDNSQVKYTVAKGEITRSDSNIENDLCLSVIKDKSSKIINDTEMSKEILNSPHCNSDKAFNWWIGVPLIIDEDLLGTLCIYHSEAEEEYTENDIEVLELIAHQVAAGFQRKLAKDQIHKLSVSVEQSPTSVMITDVDGIIEYVNPTFTKVTGYTIEELQGKTPSVLKSGRHDRIFYEKMWRKLRVGKTWRGEFINKKKNGELIWELASISPLKNDTGKITHFVEVKEDITDRKAKEKEIVKLNAELEEKVEKRTRQLRETNKKLEYSKQAADRIVDATPIPTSVTSIKEGKVLRVNKAMIEFHGMSHDAMMETSSGEWYPDANVRERLIAQMQKNGYVTNFEAKLKRLKTGEVRDTLISKILLTYENTDCMVGSVIDITDIKRIQKELENAKIKAETATETKSQFLANMSHEIRTPMNSIIGFTNLLKPMVNGELQESYLDSIHSSGKALLKLINDILDLSKIEAGRIELNYEFVEARSFFKEIFDVFELRARDKQLTLNMEIDDKLPEGILIDEIRMRQILVNLLGNAVKFTGSGSVTLEIKAEKLHHPNKRSSGEQLDMLMIVKDTGIGIPIKEQARIFKSFKQQKEQDEKKYGGTGLGLSITKKIVELMNGEIRLDSELGVGTTFRVKLPNIVVSKSFIASKERGVVYNQANTRFNPCSVLVVDDIEQNRRYIKGIFRNSEVHIQEAENGQEALTILQEDPADVVITDIKMPVMDGYKLISRMRADKKLNEIPIIASSAAVMKKEQEEILAAGFNDMLIKPFDIPDLYSALINFLPHEYNAPKKRKRNYGSVKGVPVEILKAVIAELEGELYEDWKALKEHQPMEKVDDFARKITMLGESNNLSMLTNYGNELLTAVNHFDIYSLLKHLKNYRQMSKEIKKWIK